MVRADVRSAAGGGNSFLDAYTPVYTCFMPQLALYLDPDTARRLDDAAKRAGTSRSAWARAALERKLAEETGWPVEFLATHGSIQDPRSPEEIVRDIREGDFETTREAIT